MISKIIDFSLGHKFIIFLFTGALIFFGIYSLTQISIGAVPDITNNQVQVLTTSRSLSTQDMEQFITYPIELEMANLPGVVEIRSISKFGLSVVTIVFEDGMGTYLPRQLISEKIQSATEKIPEGFGKPTLGPITTGLGEIYQYILDTKPGYEDVYSTMQLRTIQDWIVKRQLSGIPGVVEINTWGGKLKQYEVAISSEKLKAMNLTISEVMDALERNNSVSGGGYIEKSGQAYFIRGEGLVENLEDIRNIVIRVNEGVPVYVRDIAQVGYGSAVRFGAITGNGEGEKVLGQVMMLKDANSKKVIDAVRERVEEIQSTLPEGVYINAFLDRSDLIGKTTATITENLVLGCLIVIFVVVLLLGNIRSGLVVASVIPLSLLFALSLMYLFDVDANLMSLGAIDFGIIIDGAVIIVEYIAYKLSQQAGSFEQLSGIERQRVKDAVTRKSATNMMNSAVFGQLIILIVFIPILSLSGVEGKMFRPMALTFSFALIGAMILCFTYVPVASAVFIKPARKSSKNISVRIMRLIDRLYEPVIRGALRAKTLVLSLAVLLLAVAVVGYLRLGGEFIPTLDEGDFVIQPILPTGTSLTSTIETTTRIEQILLDQFPEVEQVVTRIGAAEVPTDPMSMEDSDVIIILKPKSDWVSASTKDELANLFKEALSVIPGMGVEFTQPIEMRFNELITGVRADIAIKIFGEDLDLLTEKANEIKSLAERVPGAADITVEKIVGLPQMAVTYDRSKIARYGLNVSELNEIVSMGFAGYTTGSVFEGERRFDLVMRLEEPYRRDISNLRSLYVDLPGGGKVPLNELAEISYQEGAAKISRDDTRRRTVVGINVRDRDLESVVTDIRNLVGEHVQFPAGYNVTYGGQFENLQSAKERLRVAVPIALVLIFIMLFFAFSSLKEAVLVFSAIPLAAVGGVFLLWIRGMPFSISAGVGFIALFGIAVLNGIVLIEHLKELSKEGFKSFENMIIQATRDRLRPVLLTASAAALGFLPMAVSGSAGAEVQRPLATVVIGGLVTATLLTLIVLPVLYSMFGESRHKKQGSVSGKALLILPVLLCLTISARSQQEPLTRENLQDLAVKNNAALEASRLSVEQADELVGSAFNFDKTEVYYHYDQANLALNNEPLRVLGIQQGFLFPTVYGARKQVNMAQLAMESSAYEIARRQLNRDVESAYWQLQYERSKARVYQYLDSLYLEFENAANRRFELGESNYLEKISAQAKQRQLQTKHRQALEDVDVARLELLRLVQSPDTLQIASETLKKLPVQEVSLSDNPGLAWYENQQQYFREQGDLQKQLLLPDFNVSYFSGSNSGLDQRLNGYQIGVRLPLLFNASRVRASKIAEEIASQRAIDYRNRLETSYFALVAGLKKYEEGLIYFEEEGENLSQEILKMANLSYQNGEIDFFQYIQSVENASAIHLSYLENLNAYNQVVISINYLIE